MSRGGPPWRVERARGDASMLHQPWPRGAWGRPGDAVDAIGRSVRICDVVGGRSLVLGSHQSRRDVDDEVVTELGLSVVRRRSGGGAVVVGPGEQVWIDVFIPRGDPWWDEDALRAAHVVGAAWLRALESLTDGRVSVHTGRLLADDWGRVACFAGLGPGEVSVSGRKVVGISQRRGRSGAVFFTTAPVAVDAELTARLIRFGRPVGHSDAGPTLADVLSTRATGLLDILGHPPESTDLDAVASAVLGALAQRTPA